MTEATTNHKSVANVWPVSDGLDGDFSLQRTSVPSAFLSGTFAAFPHWEKFPSLPGGEAFPPHKTFKKEREGGGLPGSGDSLCFSVFVP